MTGLSIAGGREERLLYRGRAITGLDASDHVTRTHVGVQSRAVGNFRTFSSVIVLPQFGDGPFLALAD
jgi:hypothetical protein